MSTSASTPTCYVSNPTVPLWKALHLTDDWPLMSPSQWGQDVRWRGCA